MRRELQRLDPPDTANVRPAEPSEENYFALFGLPPLFAIDTNLLRERFHDLQRSLHPDRFAHGTDAERRASMLMAARVNDAYALLRSPLQRARYLLLLQGIAPSALDGVRPTNAFLQMQMDWREAFDEAYAAHNRTALDALASRVLAVSGQRYDDLAAALTRQRSADAAVLIAELQFLERLSTTIVDGLDRMDAR